MENRLFPFDVLRGLLATWVMIAHVVGRVLSDRTIQNYHLQAVLEPLIPVYVFMILSGFVIFYFLDQEYGGYRSFLARRFFRLAPLYFVILPLSALAVGFELRTLHNLPWRNGDIIDSISVHREALVEFWPHLLAHVSLLHGAIPDHILKDAPFTFLSQGWSVSLEWQFYLIAPLIFLLAKAGRYWRVALIVFILAILGTIHHAVGYLPNQMHYFAAGILSFYAYRYSSWYAGIRDSFRLLALLLVFWALYLWMASPLPWMVWLAAMHVVLTTKANPRSVLSRMSQSPALRWLGEVSYSVYLIHIPILYVVFAALLRRSTPWEQGDFLLGALALIVPITLGAAALTHRFIERPGIRLGRTLAQRIQNAQKS